MVLHQGENKHRIQVLLDTGCSIALMNEQTMERQCLKTRKHHQACSIESYTGEKVQRAGQFYTKPMLLQHQKHYTMESFEISSMDQEIDVFLTFRWIREHPPQGAWTSEEIRFATADCLKNCTRFEMLREASRPRYEVPRVYGTRRPGRIRFGVTGLCENFFSFQFFLSYFDTSHSN